MYKDLAEHVTTVVMGFGVLASLVAYLFWHMFRRMEAKMDNWIEEHQKCRERQNELFVQQSEFRSWKEGRPPIWRRLHGHKHDEQGRVVITEVE